MKNNLINILYLNNNNRSNNVFVYNYTIHHETRNDPLNESKILKDNFYQPMFYENVALDIVTETVFDYPYPYVSEKSFKPISTKRMFIIVGACNTLKFLKDIGFKTFSSYINEAYDTVEDPAIRMSLIEHEIKTFVEKPLKEVKEILLDAKEILEHNFLNLTKLYDSELQSIQKQLDNQNV
jgi:hypothetical protein